MSGLKVTPKDFTAVATSLLTEFNSNCNCCFSTSLIIIVALLLLLLILLKVFPNLLFIVSHWFTNTISFDNPIRC